MTNGIKEQILAFHERLTSDPHHRYRSWEHCFSYFRQRAAFTSPEHIDTASLHLAFYLASWGMYRGSSALLWKDYRIHQLAISKVLAPEFSALWDLGFHDATQDSTAAGLIVALSTALRAIYRQQITTVDGAARDFIPSDTLITKFLLGTVGCTPACDRYFILGLRHAGLRYSRFSATFLREVFRFCREHRDTFCETQEVIAQRSEIRYPLMKLVDMYFWKLGFDLLPEAEADETAKPL
jgi:hypothetical protein